VPLFAEEDVSHRASREAVTDKFNKDYLDTQLRIAEATEQQARTARRAAIWLGVDAVIAGGALMFLIGTYRATRRQADLAQRPKFVIREILFSATDAALNIRSVIANAGEGRGTIVESYGQVQTVKAECWSPPDTTSGKNLIGGYTLAPGQQVVWNLTVPMEPGTLITITHAAELIAQGKEVVTTIYFGGAFIYADDNGIRRRTAFLRRWDPRTDRFSRSDDPDYEYVD
jgi:hypothetical protein